MIKIECYLSIGYSGAKHEDEMEFEDGTSDEVIDAEVYDWAQNYIEHGWKVVKESDDE